jgi:ABC-type multidrug transport system ATPase subunit
MKISLSGIGKRYGRYWVFKEVTQAFEPGNSYALLGNNGSGKSTLLRIIAGMQSPSAGKAAFAYRDRALEPAAVFEHLSFCAPGMELPEELTMVELLQFHFTFKKIVDGMTINDIVQLTGLKRSANKPIGDYSSGMKQRVKLAQAFFSDTPLLLLDEPCTNLDEAGVAQYLEWIGAYTKGRTVVVASNDEREYGFCTERILMSDYV